MKTNFTYRLYAYSMHKSRTARALFSVFIFLIGLNGWGQEVTPPKRSEMPNQKPTATAVSKGTTQISNQAAINTDALIKMKNNAAESKQRANEPKIENEKVLWTNEPFGDRDMNKEILSRRDAFAKLFNNGDGAVITNITNP